MDRIYKSFDFLYRTNGETRPLTWSTARYKTRATPRLVSTRLLRQARKTIPDNPDKIKILVKNIISLVSGLSQEKETVFDSVGVMGELRQLVSSLSEEVKALWGQIVIVMNRNGTRIIGPDRFQIY